MSRREKLLRRFLAGPRDFTWQELVTLLEGFGYQPEPGGRTGGSRVRFVHPERGPISLHRPHPGDVRRYQIEQVRALLEEEGLL
jgi:HicA toxin of bacterial toxin-antitoxin,